MSSPDVLGIPDQLGCVTVNGPVKHAVEKRKLYVMDEDKEQGIEIVKKTLRLGPRPREVCLTLNYDRATLNIELVLTILQTKQFQAIATVARMSPDDQDSANPVGPLLHG